MLGFNAQEIDQHEGRSGQESEQAGEDQGVGQGITEKADVRRDGAVVPQQAAHPQWLAVFRAHGLGNAKSHDYGHDQSIAGQDDENRGPAQAGDQKTTDGRSNCWCQGHDAGQDGHDAGGLTWRVDVTDRGATQYGAS